MSRLPLLRRRLGLIVVTDPDCGPGRQVVEVVKAALEGGAPAVQLRAKHAGGRDMMQLAHRLREETRRAGALFFVNDRLDVALAAGADGAHIGQDDIPLSDARRIVSENFVLGLSVDSAEHAREAERLGADYLGVGPVFATASKDDAGAPIGLDGLASIVDATDLPVVAIGGIDSINAPDVRRAGAAGVAVIRAVMQAEDPREAARALLP